MKPHECPATVKICKDCKEEKSLDQFYVKRRLKSGNPLYMAQCKACFGARSARSYEKRKEAKLARCKEYRSENAEQVAEYLRRWYQRNRTAVIEKTKAYQARPERKAADHRRQVERYAARRTEIRAKQNARNATPEGRAKQRARFLKHYAENKAYYFEKTATRRATLLRAMPQWVNSTELRRFYKQAIRLTKETGVRHAVDHIVPLRGRKVCGLHVPWNLQVITAVENSRKRNHHDG